MLKVDPKWRQLIPFDSQDHATSLWDLQTKTGYYFRNLDILLEAMCHKSALYRQKKRIEGIACNERLEFLGDAVIDLVISDRLWQDEKGFSEGEMSRIRSEVVNRSALAELARELGVDRAIILGRSESRRKLNTSDSLLADCIEAYFGAVYLDGGFDRVHSMVAQLFTAKIQGALHETRDYKTALQEYVQKKYKETPKYEATSCDGPDHRKLFKVAVSWRTKVMAYGTGMTKKVASQAAAQKALAKIT